MRTALLLAVLLALAVPLWAQAPLNFEAEAVCTPTDAWVKDKVVPGKWNLWSTDNDAAKKWSGGVVLQSPPVLKDFEKPEDGCPVLHVVIPDLAPGTYEVAVKYGRGLAFSLDQQTWKRCSETGGRIGRFEVKDGKLEFWVDDRFVEPTSPGSCYFDNLTVSPVLTGINGVVNGDFEFGDDPAKSGWGWWSRDNAGSAAIVKEGRNGSRCAKLQYDGKQDWAYTNAGRWAVKPGQILTVNASLKCQDSGDFSLFLVGMGQGKVISYSLAGDGVWGTSDWTQIKTTALIPSNVDEVQVRLAGYGKMTGWVDDVSLAVTGQQPPAPPKGPVTGWAKTRVEEKLGRGVVALPTAGGKVYVGWRWLKGDDPKLGFNVYRAFGRMLPVKLNAQPLTKTTDFVDEQPNFQYDQRYFIRPVLNGKELPASEVVTVEPNAQPRSYVSVKLQGDYTFQKLGLGDLDGDGRMDYVIKQPQDNIDPYDSYWSASPDTYKLEAYDADGKFLWRFDLGWGIERGIWYSPCLVYDLDGDGKAEVVAKFMEGDPRGPDGRVNRGEEFAVVLDGATGKEITRVAWPSRLGMGGGLSGYNYAARNQMGIAFLDGKTPCLLLQRGTYTIMKLDAYQFQNRKLTRLWYWDSNEATAGKHFGQGAHWLHSGDVDGDGRDEVLLGSNCLDDDGKALWSTGLGHPDRCFLGDLDPNRPGLEVFYHIEPGQMKNGMCLVDAKTGEIIWGLPERTYHVGAGMAADIDPDYPGCEVWASEDGKGDPKGQNYNGNPPRWLCSVKGEILARDEKVPPFAAVYWDADSQRELTSGRRVYKYKGEAVAQDLEGSQVFWGDILGDWREEIVTSVKGELRIYTTTLPASERRTCLLQDPIYRHDVAHEFMGYTQPPTLGYFLAQVSPALRLTAAESGLVVGKPVTVKVSLAAAAKEAVSGTVKLTGDANLSVTPETVTVQASAGQTAEATCQVTLKQAPALLYGGQQAVLGARLQGADNIAASAVFRIEELPLTDVPLAQAEAFTEQSGGQVQIREDKFGAVGKAISHWDSKDHALTWKLTTPAEGKYWLVLRYCTPAGAKRQLLIDGSVISETNFGSTGGFGSPTQSDWAHQCFRDDKSQRVNIPLTAGEHVIKIVNTDGRGMNLDYVALVPVK